MRSTWKRAFATLLTIALLASLLVVPASAAQDILEFSSVTLVTDGDKTTTVGNFKIIYGSKQKISSASSAVEFADGTKCTDRLEYSGKSNNATTDVIQYTITGASADSPVPVKVYWADNTGSSRGTLGIGIGNISDKTEASDTSGKAYITTWEATTNGTLTIGFNNQKGYIYKVVVGEADLSADDIKLTFDVAEGLDVTDLTVANTAKDFKSPLTVTKNTAVTFKVAPKSDIYTVDEVKFGDTVLTAEDGVYTIADVGADNATVTITATSARVAATGVTISGDATANMSVGAAVTLSATAEPSNTTDTVSWASRDAGVATVGNDGTVTAVAIGKTTVTATASGVTATDSDPKATRDVTVIGADQTGDSYTFESKIMGAVTAYGAATEVKYDNHFSVMFGSGTKVDGSNKSWSGEGIAYESAQRLALGGAGSTTQNALKITTGAAATVNIWWVANKVNGKMILQDSAGTVVAVDGTNQETAAATANNTELTGQLSIPAAGTYYLVSSSEGGNYLFKVEVTEESAPVVTKTDLSGKTVSLDKTAPVVGDVLTATVSDSIPAADVDFVWTVGDTVATGKTATYTVAAADMGKVIKVKAQAKTGSATYENATPEVSTSAVVGKTMTVSAENVTDTYDGTAKTITVTGAPAGATITYCATSDGTYTATQPEMKNASDTAYTVYYKVNAAGYQEATGSATLTINKAAAPDISFTVVNTNIPAEGRTVTFTVKGVPADSAVAPAAVCDQAAEGTTISFTKQADGSYKGTNAVTASDDGSARTHTVVMTWADPNYVTVTKTVTLKQAAQGAVVPAEAAGLAIGSGVDYAALGVDATVSAEDNSVTLNIDEAKILAAYAANPDTFKGGNMNHGGNAYMMVQFEAPTGVTTAWTVKQAVGEGAEGDEWKLDGTGGDLDCWAEGDKLMIGDWFGVLMGVDGATQSMPAEDTYVMLYNFYDGTECKAATTYTVVRNVINAATVTLTANADLADVTVPAKVSPEEAFELTVAVKSGVDKVLPDTITVTKNGAAMSAANYTWNQATGKLTIAADKINPTDAIVVTVVPVAPAPTEYTVTVTAGANGTATASVDKAAAGTEVTLTVTPATGYVVDAITSADVTVTDNKFTMPAKDVTINVTFKAEGGESVEDATLFDPALLVVAADNTPVTTDMLKAVFGNRFSAAVITEGDHADYVKARRNSDGVTTSLEIKENGKASFTFVIKSGETFDVTAKLSSNNSSDATAYTLKKGDTEVKSGDVGVSSAPTEVTWEGLTEGTYTLTSSGAKSIRIIRLEMTAPQGGETKDITFTVPAGAELAELKVGGETATLTGGKLTVATDAVVTFKVNVTDDAKELDTVTGATEADGVYTVNADAVVIALKDKTSTPVVNKDALKADIKAAQDLVKNTTFTAQEDNLAGEKYWDDALKTAYETAIADAQAVVDNAEATADDVADAKAALATATATFKAGKTDGTKVLTDDELKTALADAITAATAAKKDVVANDATDPSTVANGTKYVPTAVMTALENALKDAEDLKALLDDEDAENDPTAEALTAALVALKNATTDFQPETGTKSSSTSRPSIGSGTKPTGETTKTETLGDGTTVTTTTDSKGNTTVVTKRPDGMETTTVTNEDGDVVITTVNADDVTLAEVKVPATIPANDQKFVDVPEGHWAEASINNMAALNMVKGVDDVNHIFDMNSDVTRGSVATILYRFANGKDGMSQNFSDVAEGQWYTDAVAWASNAGVVTGYENGTFQPDGSITREQLAVMIYRYAKLIGLDVSEKGDLTVFTDGANVQSWAVDGMAWCVKSGIINGRGDGTVDPATAATRAEAAAMLDRFVALLK